MERWSGKVAVVTGASSGIGAAVVKTLAEHGMITVGLARRVDDIKKIAKSSNGTIHAIKCDVTKDDDVFEAFKWINTNLGGVDLLINNAGTFNLASISSGAPEKWRQVFDVNVLGLSLCTQEALKTMRTRGDDGHIININSVMGHNIYPIPSMVMYTSSKHALIALTKTLRIELKQSNSKIKVTSISPGGVDTEMVARGRKEIYGGVQLPHMSPENILSSQDLADIIVNTISMKPHIQIEELIVENIRAPSY